MPLKFLQAASRVIANIDHSSISVTIVYCNFSADPLCVYIGHEYSIVCGFCDAAVILHTKFYPGCAYSYISSVLLLVASADCVDEVDRSTSSQD